MDLAALLFDVNAVLRRFAAGQGGAVDAEQLAAALRALEAGAEVVR
jgi:hypothetical protein